MTTDAVLPICESDLESILRMIHLLLGPDEAGPGFFLTQQELTNAKC